LFLHKVIADIAAGAMTAAKQKNKNKNNNIKMESL
jgi:hypothetical protein